MTQQTTQASSKYFNVLDLSYVNKVTKTSLDIMKSKVEVKHMIDPLAKLIFSLAVRAVSERGMFCPEIDLQYLVDDDDRLEKFKAFNYPYKISDVKSLLLHINTFETDASIKSMESTILERFSRASLLKISEKLQLDLTDSVKSTKELLRGYSYSLDTLMSSSSTSMQVLTANDAVQQEIDYINSPMADAFPTTGVPIIDMVNSGLNAPSVTIICGESKSGKSSLLYNVCVDSLKQGRTVLFGTIEIPSNECMRKIICCYFNLDYNTINKKLYETEEEKEQYKLLVEKFREETKDRLFVIDDDNGISCKTLETQCLTLEKAGIIIQDIISDYTLIMKSNNPKLSDKEALQAIPCEMRQLSKKTNTRVFSAAQLHTTQKEFKDVSTEDIYWMKNLAHEVTYILAIKNIKNQDNSIDFFMKFLPSRQLWTGEIYKFPLIDFDKLYLGRAVVWNESSEQEYSPVVDVSDSRDLYNWAGVV